MFDHMQRAITVLGFIFSDEPHLSVPHVDTATNEEVTVASPPQLEGEAATAMRPSLSSGYPKQFQKSLPPRFLRQQVQVHASQGLISLSLFNQTLSFTLKCKNIFIAIESVCHFVAVLQDFHESFS